MNEQSSFVGWIFNPNTRLKIGIVIVLVILTLATLGIAGRGSGEPLINLGPLREGFFSRPSDLTLLDSQDGYALFAEVSRTTSRVYLRTPNQPAWLLVSRDDLHAANPALSPKADRVAYLSTGGDVRVVIVPLNEAEVTEILAALVDRAAYAQQYTNVTICDWSPIAWSSEGNALAFFGCRDTDPRTMAFVAYLGESKVEVLLVPESENASATERQLLWADDDELIMDFPGAEEGLLRTLEVPQP